MSEPKREGWILRRTNCFRFAVTRRQKKHGGATCSFPLAAGAACQNILTYAQPCATLCGLIIYYK